MTKRTTLIISMMLGAFLMGTVFIFAVKPYPGADFAVYQRLGHNIAAGRGYSQEISAPFIPDGMREPLYPMFLAVVYRLFGFNDVAVYLIQALLYSLSAFILYRASLEIADERTSILAGFIFALCPFTAYYCGMIYAEILATFLLVTVTYLLTRYVRTGGVLALVIAGLLTGCLILTKRMYVFYPFAVAGALFLRRRPNIRRKALEIIVIIFTMAAVMAPWAMRNYATFGRFIPLVNGYGPGVFFYISTVQFKGNLTGVGYENNPLVLEQFEQMFQEGGFSPAEKESFPFVPGSSAICFKYAIKNIQDDPADYVAGLIKKIPRLFVHVYSPGHEQGPVYITSAIALAIYAIGLYGIWVARASWRKMAFFLLPIVYLSLTALLTVMTSRYTVPARPHLMFFAAAALMSALNRRRGPFEKKL
ncbi:MAG: glycosyltransferase family 39 protein [Candidatus Omnitrophica bacterium]|nr:glycosyltransferase family 39 protein [Candidatus Omnitrophota bacterium]